MDFFTKHPINTIRSHCVIELILFLQFMQQSLQLNKMSILKNLKINAQICIHSLTSRPKHKDISN